MEEILASIRRIISEDEGNAQAEAAPSAEPSRAAAASDEGDEGADIQIIDDIARVLSGAHATPPAEAAQEPDDEILDLMDLGLAEAPAEEAMVEEFVIVEETVVEMAPRPSFTDAFPPQAEMAAEQEAAEPEMSEPMPMPASEPYIPAAPEYIEMPPPEAEIAAAPEPESAPEPEPVAPPIVEAAPPAEDPTLALERAIEALKAGDLAAFARAAESKYVPPAPTAYAAEPLPKAGPTLEEQFSMPAEPAAVAEEVVAAEEFVIEPELEVELQAEPSVEEPETFLDEPEPDAWTQSEAAPEPSHEESHEEPAGVSTPWHADDTTWSPRTTPPADYVSNGNTGGSSHKMHDFAVPPPQTLEDSVKEMLRPMLRKWLDENMQRVLTQALREELEDKPATRRDS
jgi:cell pole-organizing protein PopZ